MAVIEAAVTDKLANTGVIFLSNANVSELAFLGTMIVDPGYNSTERILKKLGLILVDVPFG